MSFADKRRSPPVKIVPDAAAGQISVGAMLYIHVMYIVLFNT